LPASNQIADLDLHDITSALLAVDRQIEERAVSKPLTLIEEEPYGPDLTGFQGPFCADVAPGIPSAKLSPNRVELCLSHRNTPSASMAEGEHGARFMGPLAETGMAAFECQRCIFGHSLLKPPFGVP
jgi:hypothetical protein